MDEVKLKIKDIATNIEKLAASITTEEATKNAFIMPFIRALGYDVFNPLEVMPEYTQDIGTKQGERIDYAIFQNNEPVLLIECKKIGAELNAKNESQLLRYFNVSKAKFAILTNGRDYKFYTDLEEKKYNGHNAIFKLWYNKDKRYTSVLAWEISQKEFWLRKYF